MHEFEELVHNLKNIQLIENQAIPLFLRISNVVEGNGGTVRQCT